MQRARRADAPIRAPSAPCWRRSARAMERTSRAPARDSASAARTAYRGRRTPGRSLLRLHPADVRDDRQVSRALDRGRQLTLVTRADAAQAARQNLAVVGDESAERAVVFVVDETNARLAEWTGLLWATHGYSSSSSSSASRRRLAAASSSSDIGGAPTSCSNSVIRWRTMPSSSLMARSYSGSEAASAEKRATA